MRSFLILITMPDGSQGQHHGLYMDGFAAAIHAMDLFPDAMRVGVRRLSA